MKLFAKFALFAAAVLSVGALASCSDDDDNGGNDFSDGLYQEYEVDFINDNQATVFANFRQYSEHGKAIRFGKGQGILANGYELLYRPEVSDGFDYRYHLQNLRDNNGIVTFDLVLSKSRVFTNTVEYDYVTTPDLKDFPKTIKAGQRYTIGIELKSGEEMSVVLIGASDADPIYTPTILGGTSFIAPAFEKAGAYTARVLIKRNKNIVNKGDNDAGFIRVLKMADTLVRIEP